MRALGLWPLLAFYLSMAAIAVGVLVASGDPGAVFPALGDLEAWILHGAAGLLTGLLIVGCSRVFTALFEWAEVLAGEFRSLLGDMSPGTVAVAAVLSAVGEELLFRGVLQPALGLWISTAIFAALHVGPNRRFVPWTIMAFGAGLAFGGLFLWTGDLLAPILAHMVINYLNLRHLTLTPTQGPEVQLVAS